MDWSTYIAKVDSAFAAGDESALGKLARDYPGRPPAHMKRGVLLWEASRVTETERHYKHVFDHFRASGEPLPPPINGQMQSYGLVDNQGRWVGLRR